MSAKILVVDDNPTNLKLVSDVLEFEGYDILKAVDAEEAQVVLSATLPDLILMDIALPGMDGLTLTRKLKAEERTRGIRIVALTAFAMKGDDQKAFDAGCDGYITKPIDTRKLTDQVAEFLARASGQSPRSRIKILVIEDNTVDNKLATLILSTTGHDVSAVEAAEQVFGAIKEDRPQLILLDLDLTGMDGLVLLRKLKADPDTREICVVAITFYPEQYSKAAALAAGCDAYLLKPLDTRELSEPLAALAEEAARSTGRPKKGPMNILIVDDTPINLKLLRAQLESEGHAVFEAHNGMDALALLECQPVDAVISDILMPKMDGYRLCLEIRKQAPLRNLPIIIYTSTYISPGDEKLAIDMGADKYLKKPASVETLVAALLEVSARPHAALQPKALQEFEVLKEYNERLVSKLKEKNTELQTQTEALRASEERYRLLFERAPDVIFALAPTGAITSLNYAFETITGWPPAQWLGRPFQDILYLDDQPRAGELFQLVLGGERVPTFKLRMRTVAGGFRDVEFTGFSSELSGGRIEVQGIGRDITERLQAQEEILRLNAELEERVQQRTAELEFANQQMEAFSYSVSHDLRSPLTAIDGFGNLLSKEIGASAVSDRGKHYLVRIRAGVVQMGELIDALLSLAKVSRTSLRLEDVDLSALAETLLTGYREREPGRVAQLAIQAGMVVHGDPNLLRQVLDNLLGNAWKFSGQQPQTHIAFDRESGPNGEAKYVVRDKGAGFDMAYSEKLFSAFQRLHTESEFAGTGIGLATVQRIVTRHGGRIWAESRLGEGATFYFTLGSPSA